MRHSLDLQIQGKSDKFDIASYLAYLKKIMGDLS